MKEESVSTYGPKEAWAVQNVNLNVPRHRIDIDVAVLTSADVKIWDIKRTHSLAIEYFKLTIC